MVRSSRRQSCLELRTIRTQEKEEEDQEQENQEEEAEEEADEPPPPPAKAPIRVWTGPCALACH